MTRTKKLVAAVLVIFILIQFIRPTRNESKDVLPTDISYSMAVPPQIQKLIKSACYDCHSNSTAYPWYINIQPGGWYMAYHVRNGKKELNFSDFASYSGRKQANKLKAVAREVEKGDMPLSSYTLLHPAARLNSTEKQLIMAWATHAQDGLGQ